MSVDIRKPLRKYLPHLLEAQANNLNEADTVQRLIKVFEEVLGYDAMSDISREAQMKNKFVDIALKVDGVIRLLVEAKAAGEKLRDRHIEQAQAYASRNNFRWVLLTNGVVWNVYHLTFEEGIEYERAFSVDVSNPDGFEETSEKLSLLHKQSIKKGDLEHFWQKSRALNPATIGKAIFLDSVIALIRREIRRETEMLIDPEDLCTAIHGMMSSDAREMIGPAKIRKVRSRNTSIYVRKSAEPVETTEDAEGEPLPGRTQEQGSKLPSETGGAEADTSPGRC